MSSSRFDGKDLGGLDQGPGSGSSNTPNEAGTQYRRACLRCYISHKQCISTPNQSTCQGCKRDHTYCRGDIKTPPLIGRNPQQMQIPLSPNGSYDQMSAYLESYARDLSTMYYSFSGHRLLIANPQQQDESQFAIQISSLIDHIGSQYKTLSNTFPIPNLGPINIHDLQVSSQQVCACFVLFCNLKKVMFDFEKRQPEHTLITALAFCRQLLLKAHQAFEKTFSQIQLWTNAPRRNGPDVKLLMSVTAFLLGQMHREVTQVTRHSDWLLESYLGSFMGDLTETLDCLARYGKGFNYDDFVKGQQEDTVTAPFVRVCRSNDWNTSSGSDAERPLVVPLSDILMVCGSLHTLIYGNPSHQSHQILHGPVVDLANLQSRVHDSDLGIRRRDGSTPQEGETKAQGDGHHAFPERGNEQVTQASQKLDYGLTVEKAQDSKRPEGTMIEQQHMIDRALSDHFGFADSAYGTGSFGCGNGKFATDSASPQKVNSTAQDTTDAVSIYSMLSATNSVMHTYLQDLADDLFSAIYTPQIDPKRLQRLCKTLEQLLQQFAFKIGDELSSQEGQEILYHVHRNRREIVDLFKQHLLDIHDYPETPSTRASDQISAQEKVWEWFNEGVPNENPLEDELEWADDKVGTRLDRYNGLVRGTSAYEWLTTAMRQQLVLVTQEEDIRGAICKEITEALPRIPRFSIEKKINRVQLLYAIRWDPETFILEQKYSGKPFVALETAITLTGTFTDAQALPCLQYMRQTWPMTGEHTLRLIQRLLGSRQGVRTRVDSGNSHSDLVAWKTSHMIYVEVVGSRSSVVEIGEQLAWLGSALRSSPFAGIALCSPYISTGDQTLDDMKGLRYQANRDDSLIVKIDFALEEGKAESNSEGRCWHRMFRNPVVVRGFPILERDSPFPGLEIPLYIMAGLVQASRAYAFDETIILKGFSSMLVPIEQSSDMTLWHHFFHADGTRITYLERGVSANRVRNFSKIQATRHIVGWCNSAKNYTGKAGARYDVARSRLRRVGSGFLLEKVSLTAGKYVTPAFNFAVGVKDTPVHLPRKPYLVKLSELSHKFFVFWDTEAKRGWLVNGLDGLLHLLRATLKHYEKDEFLSLVVMSKSEDISEPPNESGTYAFNVLRNESNMKLPIIPDKDDVEVENEDPNRLKRRKNFIRLEDWAEELCGHLEILIDHQTEKAGQSGINIKTHLRRRLEGWDFKDLVSNNDPIYPLVETIEAVGRGWVDFTRSIQAVTLFGKGFGDIIRPSDEIKCSYWGQLPKGNFYLAACISDLKRVMEMKNGDDMAIPRKMCDGISWFSPTPPSEVCRCSKSGVRRHLDPVRVLWPTSLTNRLPLTKKVPLPPEGAVIFGHNARFKWRWGDYGDPVEGDPTIESPELGSHQLTQTTTSQDSRSGEDQSTAETSLQPPVTKKGDGKAASAPDETVSRESEEGGGGHPVSAAKTKAKPPTLMRWMKNKFSR